MKRKITYYMQWLKSFLRLDVDLRNEIKLLEQKLEILESEKKDFHAAQLRKYVKKGCTETLKECEHLIETDEALKHFGEMWGKYKADTMMMFTALEAEYIQNYDFTEAEIRVLKHIIGNIGLFFRECKQTHDTKIELQKLKEQAEKENPE